MNEARAYSLLSCVLLGLSVAIFSCAAYFGISLPWPLIFAVAVPLAWSLIRGEFARRASLGLPKREELGFEGAAPKWLWVVGLLLPLVLLPGLFRTEEGRFDFSARPATEQTWSEREGRYFTRAGSEPERQISRAEYERGTRRPLKFLALGLAFFSFVSLVLWQQEEMLRNRRGNEN